METNNPTLKEMAITASVAIVVILVVLFLLSVLYKHYNVYSMGLEGEALLAKATQTRQIQIEQARAELESAKLRAEAIELIGEKAKKYPEYRHQEFIGAFAEAMKEGTIQQIIYIPTEAGIPITEASKR